MSVSANLLGCILFCNTFSNWMFYRSYILSEPRKAYTKPNYTKKNTFVSCAYLNSTQIRLQYSLAWRFYQYGDYVKLTPTKSSNWSPISDTTYRFPFCQLQLNIVVSLFFKWQCSRHGGTHLWFRGWGRRIQFEANQNNQKKEMLIKGIAHEGPTATSLHRGLKQVFCSCSLHLWKPIKKLISLRIQQNFSNILNTETIVHIILEVSENSKFF